MIFAEAERCNSPRLPSLNGRGFPASKPPVQSPDRQAPANIPVPNAPIAHEEVATPYTSRQNVGLCGNLWHLRFPATENRHFICRGFTLAALEASGPAAVDETAIRYLLRFGRYSSR